MNKWVASFRSLVSLGLGCSILLLGACGGDASQAPAPASLPPLTPPSSSGSPIKHVFVISMENINWTQPSDYSGSPALYGNAAAPFINSLVTPRNPNAAQVAFATNYLNVVAGGLPLHPSESNYVWAEAGLAGPLDDADPYPANIVNAPSLSAALAASGKTWRSYQEDIDLSVDATGMFTNDTLPESQWTVPANSLHGASSAYINAYNGSNNFDYAAKHNPQLFFTATNGGTTSAPDLTPGNPQARNYVPLSRLADDLRTNNVAQYNWITPNQFNDMHTPLPSGFRYAGQDYAGVLARIAQGDNFLAHIVPLIMSSQAYKDGGLIIIWTDETVGETAAALPAFTMMEIVISPYAKGDAYASAMPFDHTSDLLTMQRIFGLSDFRSSKSSANDLRDLFQSGAIP